ncbi:MAG: HAMP domain-containing protein [Betaproteobacteria bacterium]|nr:MAG: HAMP domain-containing protein [Betaproteobacteria bacterium]
MTLRWRLFPKYATLIIVLVGGMLAASGGISLYFSYRENQEHLVELQREKAQSAATRIEQYIRDIEHQLGWTALPQVGAGGNAVEQRRFEYLKLLRQAPAITEVAWIDNSGREQLKVSRLAMDVSGADSDRSKDPRFLQAKSGKTWYSPVYFRKETEPYMTISRPAGSGGGVTVAEVNLKFVWEVVSRIKIGQAGLAFVIDATGTLIAHPDISLVLQKTDLTKLTQVAGLATTMGAEDDLVAPSLARDLKGAEVLTAHARIPTLNWTVFVELPLAEAFKPIYASIKRMGLLLLAGLVVSMLASFFLARLMVRPIRALQEGAAQIGAGNLDQKITVTTGDELETLAGQFNQMAAHLKESYAGLEGKVEARTREVSEALEQQTATAEILRVISSSPTDVQPVFEAIQESAMRLFSSRLAAVYRYDGQLVHLVANRGWSPESIALASKRYPAPPDPHTMGGRAILGAKVVTLENAESDLSYDRTLAAAGGWRRVLAAPMLKDGVPVGAIVVAWPDPGQTPDRHVNLLKTFADQAVIAIENVRLFHEIQEKSIQLEIAGKHKSEFLANMSHELRTPLNAIIGFSEVLLEKMFGEMNEKQEDYLKDIHSSGQHLLSLINDILDLAKVEAGRMELNLASCHLPSAIDNALALIRERAQRHGIALSTEVDAQLGEFEADERKLKQILLNLLSNAVKFTPEGGSITVSARPLADMVEIAVTDTGVGIAAEDHAAVFEEFKQVGKDYTRKAEGTGLGLALTRKFVELHGGTMRLESEPGKGSTFFFTLPFNSTAPGTAATAA